MVWWRPHKRNGINENLEVRDFAGGMLCRWGLQQGAKTGRFAKRSSAVRDEKSSCGEGAAPRHGRNGVCDWFVGGTGSRDIKCEGFRARGIDRCGPRHAGKARRSPRAD